jgi:predicted glycoside hydrolase/deacetylase ChbG (UPF0249 family)
MALLKRFALGRIRLAEVELELRAQLEKIINTGLQICHLDSHQHWHALPPLFEIVSRFAKEYRIPVVRCPAESGKRDLKHLTQGHAVRVIQRMALSFLSNAGRARLSSFGLASTCHFSGFMDMGRWTKTSLTYAISNLRPGITEICCHPRAGRGATTEPYRGFQQEPEVFTSQWLRELLAQEDVKVTSFRHAFAASPTP